MAIRIKKKYGGSVKPGFVLEDLQKAVDSYQSTLKIKSDVLITLKKKEHRVYGDIATTFYNQATQGVSIHCFVHSDSSLLPMCIILAHELVHAWQLDNGYTPSEEQADEMGLDLAFTYCASVSSLHLGSSPLETVKVCRTFIN